MKKICIALIFLLLACQSNEREYIRLLHGDFDNYSHHANGIKPVLFVEQYSEKTFRFIYNDTVYSKIDSTLHSKLYDLKFDNMPRDEFPFEVHIVLMSSLKYQYYRKLIKELQKSTFHTFVLYLDNGNKIRKKYTPFFDTETEYFDPRLKQYFQPFESKQLTEPFISKNKYVHSLVSENKITIFDPNKDVVSNYKSLSSKNEGILNIYQIDSSATYQDYIDFTILAMKPIMELRDSLISSGYTLEQAKKMYPMAIIEKSLP
jgi:hypothetical protein